MAAPPPKPQPDHSRAKNSKHSREKAQGFVYFIQSIHGGPVKIGWAKNPKARLPELQCGSPVKLIIAGELPGTLKDERALHRRFAEQRLHGEWFTPTLEMEHLAGARLRRDGREMIPIEHGGAPGALQGPLRKPHAEIFWALVDVDRWVSTAQLKRETGLVANGGLLQGLRNRGLVRSRVEEVWQDFNQHSTTYWATWLVAAREPKAAIA